MPESAPVNNDVHRRTLFLVSNSDRLGKLLLYVVGGFVHMGERLTAQNNDLTVRKDENNSERVPVAPAVATVCDVDVDPWQMTSAGSLLLTAESGRGDAVAEAVVVDEQKREAPTGDPSWEVFKQLSKE